MRFITNSGTIYRVLPKGGLVLTPTGVSETFHLAVFRQDGVKDHNVPSGAYADCFWLKPLEEGKPAMIATDDGHGTIETTRVLRVYDEVTI